MKNTRLENIFPIYEIDKHNIVYTRNGDMAICMELQYLEVFNIHSSTYATIFDTIKTAIRQLGVGYIVHKQDFFIEDKYKPNYAYNETGNDILLKNELHFKDRPFLNHKAYLYVILPSVSPLKRDSLQSSIFKLKWLPKEYNQSLLENFLQKTSAFIQQVGTGKNLKARVLQAGEILNDLLPYYTTLSFEDKSIYDIDLKNGLNIAGKHTATFVINDLEQFQQSDLNPITEVVSLGSDTTIVASSIGFDFGLNLKINHIYNQILYIEDQDKLKKDLGDDIRRHQSFSAFSRENLQSMEDKTFFIDTLLGGDSLAVKAHFNILAWSDNIDHISKYRSLIAEKMGIRKLTNKVATSYAPALWFSGIPSNASELGADNYCTMLLDNAIALMNFESNYGLGSNSNGMLLTDRYGNPRLVDFFIQPMKDGEINNRNFVVVGPSGSGKSVFMNQMITYLLCQNAHITIVDIGHSYKRLGEMLNAKYITHSDEKPIKLNPFYINKWELKQANYHIAEEFSEMIRALIFTIYKLADETDNKYEITTVNHMIEGFYMSFKDSKYSDKPINFNSFYEYITSDFSIYFESVGGDKTSFDINKFAFICRPYYKGGKYDYLLNSESNVTDNDPFIIYELDNIKDNPTLLPILTLLITNNYVSKLMKVKNTFKVLLIEEAWSAINNPFFANFLLWAYKTARKHFGGIGVVTQEINDLLKSEIIKDAIVGNAEIKIILDIAQYANQTNTVLELFKLNEKDLPKIFSVNRSQDLNITRPRYKEVSIKLGQNLKVYGTELSKTAMAVFTTEASEVDQMKKIAIAKGITEYQAALEWANN